jgi:hypothetical protein
MKVTATMVLGMCLVLVASAKLAPRAAEAGPGRPAAGTRSTFRGTSYDNPGTWKEQEQADTRVLVAPRPHPGEVLLVVLSQEIKAIKGPAADLEALVRMTEKTVTKASHGSVTSTQSGGFTVTMMASQVEDASLGKHNRIYELVSNRTHEVFVAVVAKGDATFADHRDALLQLLASCRPTSGDTGASPPPAATPPTTPAAAPSPSATAIPYADTPGKVPGDPEFRPSGRGKPIPAPAIVNGAPQGLWWTYTTTGSPTAYGTMFFPDGMALHYYRPGGPNLADLDGMKANHGSGDIGTWSLANGAISIHFGELQRSTAFSVHRDSDGTFFKAGTQIYRPAEPLTAKALVGTWEIHGIGAFTFRGDGTVQTTTSMIGSIHGLNYTDGAITGSWFLDGYLLVMSFPGEGVRVLPVFKVSGSQIVITSRFYMRT